MEEEQFFREKPSSNLLKQIISRFLPYWPIYVLLTIVSLSIAYIYLRSQTRIYVATSTVLLKDPNKSGADSKVLEALNVFGEKKIVENEILVLKSSSLMQEVVKNLNLYAVVFNKGKVQTEELYKENSPIVFEALNKELIEASGVEEFDIDWNKRNVKIAGQQIPFGGNLVRGRTVYRLLINEAYNKSAEGKNFFVVFNNVAGAAGSLIGNLQASAISYQSTVLNVQIKTPVPERGIDVLANLFEVYNRTGIEDKNKMAANTIIFIEDRLNKVTAQLDSVEAAKENYQSNNKITEMGAQAQVYSGNIAELDNQRATIQLQQDILSEVRQYVNSKGRKPGLVPATGMVEDPFLSSLLQQLYTAELERDKLRAIVGEQSEQLSTVQGNIDRLKASINENLNNIRNNIGIEKSTIDGRIALNNSMLAMVPGKERGLLEISRQQAIKNNIYTFLLQKREETALSSASTSADMRVLETPSSYGPITPVPKNYYLLGFLSGLVIFILFVQIQEQFSNKIMFRSEIESRTNVPVVAEIVQSRVKDPIAISEGKRTVIAEQFRSLRTNLNFMGFTEDSKVALVTSSISGEGKSFIATNLAISLTLTGKKVALMELDLRKPKLHRYLSVQRDPGISSYVIGKAGIEEVIKPTSHANLFLVSAGPIPPNPSELLERAAFADLMTQLRDRFDYIIIDSAPIGPVTDAMLLNQFADITVYVVRHALTPNTFLKLIQSLNKEKKFKNMSVVFNGIRPRGTSLFNYGFGGYGNGYGYGYGYGNGYGYGYGDENSGYFQSKTDQPGYKNLFGFVGRIKNFFGRS